MMNLEISKIPRNAGQILSSTGTGVDWIDPPAGGRATVNVDGSTIQGNGDTSPLFVPDDGIDTNQLADDAVNEDKIQPSASSEFQVLTSQGTFVQWEQPDVVISGIRGPTQPPKIYSIVMVMKM